MLKIAYLGHTAALSGGEIGLLRLIRHAPAIDAHVILAEDGDLVEPLREAGATVEILELDARIRGLRREELASPVRGLRTIAGVTAYARRIAERLGVIAPAVVHTNSLKAGVYGGLAGRIAGRPVVWGLHDRIAPDYLPRMAVGPMRLLVKSLPDAVMTPSQSVLESVGRRFRPGVRRVVIPLPVPAPEGSFTFRDPVQNVTHLGRFAPWKGQDVFLRAFAQAFPDGTVRARLVGSALFGEDEYANSVRRLAHELGIADRVDFAGFRRDIGAELSRADIMVNSSVLAETLGQTIIEALGLGVPVIAPRAGGPLEYLQDGQTALLHCPGDVGSLARSLTALNENAALRAAFSERGPGVAAQFSPEQINPRLEAFYRSLLGHD